MRGQGHSYLPQKVSLRLSPGPLLSQAWLSQALNLCLRTPFLDRNSGHLKVPSGPLSEGRGGLGDASQSGATLHGSKRTQLLYLRSDAENHPCHPAIPTHHLHHAALPSTSR